MPSRKHAQNRACPFRARAVMLASDQWRQAATIVDAMPAGDGDVMPSAIGERPAVPSPVVTLML
jgi:hypothetical protein